jgi:carboxyl-terminal processing protease
MLPLNLSQALQNRINPILVLKITATALALALAGCGGGPGAGAYSFGTNGAAGASGANATTKGTINDEVQFLADYMQDWYLFYKDLPQVDLSLFTTPEEALDSLRVVKDKFSNISSEAATTAFYDEGRLLAFGISNKLENDDQLLIRYVQPNSPALAAGILRGDAITAIDGKSIASLLASNEIDNAFGPQEEGITRTFTVSRSGQAIEIPVTKGWFNIASAPVANVHNVGNVKVGYVLYNQFTNPSLPEWRSAIAAVKAQGATKIIVDLRLNGGGLVDIGAQLASSLTPASAAGKLYSMIEFNDKHTAENVPINVASDTSAGSFDEVLFLTSPGTCSASEGLIVGIQPYLPSNKVTMIGETTCGKPVGFTAPSYKGKQYNILSFRGRNADGVSDYFDGLNPQCPTTDSGNVELGQANESLLAAALSYLRTGFCAPSAANGLQTKEVASNRSSQSTKSDYWRLPVHGLARQTGIQ